ncbi:MAG: nitroreductase/quinone reductase family protein [Mycobacterium sp.]
MNGYHPRMPLHYVDPNKRRGFIYRANERFSRSPLGQAYAVRFGSRIDPKLFRATGGRYGWMLGTIVTAPLTMTGARSGKRREVQVAYFHDGTYPILVASNGGRFRHPNWYYNLRAHPQCELGGEEYVAVEITDQAERERLFTLADRVYSGYADYRDKAAAVGRQIPVFKLNP